MSEPNDTPRQPRRRSLTHLTLDWLTERVRRASEIKAEIESGTYKVQSDRIAAALVNEEMKNSS